MKRKICSGLVLGFLWMVGVLTLRAETVVFEVEEDMRWTKAGNPYIIDAFRTCTVGSPDRKVTLTIGPGVVIQFRTSDAIRLAHDAALVVEGTEAEPVIFQLHEEGFRWNLQIGYRGDTADTGGCLLEHALFDGDAGQNHPAFSMVRIETPGAPVTFRDCDFGGAAGYGLELREGAAARLERCSIHDNERGGIFYHNPSEDQALNYVRDSRFYRQEGVEAPAIQVDMHGGGMPQLRDNIADDSAVIFVGATSSDLELPSMTWYVPGTRDNGETLPYVLEGRIKYGSPEGQTSILTIEAGNVIQGRGGSFLLDRGSAIKVLGEPEKPVTFTNTQLWEDENPSWRDIEMGSSANFAECEFRHAIFDHGGRTPPANGMVVVRPSDAAGVLTISHCEFRNSHGTGLWVDSGMEGNRRVVVESCQFHHNQGVDIEYRGHDEGEPLTIRGCHFYDSESDGVFARTGRVVIEQCRFERSPTAGVWIGDSWGGAPAVGLVLRNSEFVGNAVGVRFQSPAENTKLEGCTFRENTEYAVQNDKRISVDARNCDWGHDSGPLDDSDDEDTNFDLGERYHNPQGQGDPVSDDVLYAPWGNDTTVHLTIRVNDCTIGGTWPLAGRHAVAAGAEVSVAAILVCGATFERWRIVSGEGTLEDAQAPQTSIVLSGDVVLEATLSGEVHCFQKAFDSWAHVHALQLSLEGQYDPLQDSSANGLTDGLAFAMGLNPQTREFPRVEVTHREGRLRLTYPAAVAAAGIVDYVIEGSNDLRNFSEVPASEVNEVDREPGAAIDHVTAEIGAPQYRFYRVSARF